MKKFTLFLMSMFLFLGTAMAQDYSLTETRLSSDELNAKTASTLIAIKNLSATNNYYFVGNTGAAPYSAADFSDAAVFVWQPVEEGVAGSYYLMKPDGTYMQATSPKDFGTVDGAAVFTAANPTTANGEFNGDGDSQAYIDDEALLVRFMNSAAGNWINVQNGEAGTPVYNSGKGGWTIHYVYAVEAATVEPEPEPEPVVPAEGELVLALTSDQIGEAPYQLSDEDAAKVFALSDLTVAVKVNTPAAMSGRCALFCTSDPTQAANVDSKGINSAYVAYGTSNANTGYLASCKTGDRFTAGDIPVATEGVVLVYVINPTNNLFQLYINGTFIKEWNNAHADGFMAAYEIATPQMVKADYADANIYIGGGMTAEGAFEAFTGAVTGVEVYNGALTAEEIANVFAVTEPEPSVETFAVTADLFPTVEGDVTEIKGIRVEAGQGAALANLPTGWTLTNEAGDEFTMNIEWLYDYETILIMVNPAITEAGTYTLTIPAGSLTTDDDKECEAATFSWTIVNNYKPGDINKDDNITISDVVLTVNALKGIISDESVLNAADMNGDGKITISDVVSVVNALLGVNTSTTSQSINIGDDVESAITNVGMQRGLSDALHVSDASINGNEATMTVKLDNADRYNAIQLDLNLPDGVSIKNVTMNGNHTAAYNDCRIVAYSLTNRAFGAQEDIMSITLNVEDEVEYAEVTLDNILVTTTELDEQRLNAVGARIDGTTGIVDNVESTTRIYTESNCIVIETANDDVAEIVTANGIVNKAAITAGKNCIAIEHKGLYVVKVGNKAAKVVF